MSSRVTVGLMADPGLPSLVARRVQDGLEAKLYKRAPEIHWEVDRVDQALSLDSDGDINLSDRAAGLQRVHGWDMLLYLSDMPWFVEHTPMVAEVIPDRRAAAVSLPALGSFRLTRRTAQALARIADYLRQRAEGERPGRLDLRGVAPLSGATTESVDGTVQDEEGREEQIPVEQVYSPGLRSLVRLQIGMVRNNRPERLPGALTKTAAAAMGTGAFGVFFGSIWVLSDAATVGRQAMITLLVVTLMMAWLIGSNGLWERPGAVSSRRWAAMDDVATVISVGLAVLLMYAGLLLLLLSAALVIIPPDYMTQQLGHAASLDNYFFLAWLATSLGIMGGALGSSFDDDEAIRDATYSRREADRRRLARQQREENDRS